MQLFKRGSTWSFRFEIAKINGKRKQMQRGGFKTKKMARDAGIKAYHDYNSIGQIFLPSEISVSDYYALWLKDYCGLNCKNTTIQNYKRRIESYILPAIGSYKLRALNSAVLQGLINNLFNGGYSRDSLSVIKGLLTGALDYAVSPLGLLQFNPARAIKLPSKRAVPAVPTRKKERVALTDSQIDAVLRRFPEGHPYHLPIQLANRAGLRKGEAFALEWQDIDFTGGAIVVNNQIQVVGGKCFLLAPKYDSVRRIDIDKGLLQLLMRCKSQIDKAKMRLGSRYKRLFLNGNRQICYEQTPKELFLINVRQNGTLVSPSAMMYASRIIHNELGITDYDFHSLRHTHSTTLHANGVSMLEIKDRLGHCSLKMTEKYTHINEVLRKKTKQAVEEIYNREEVY